MDTDLINKTKEIEDRLESTMVELNALMTDMSKSPTFDTEEDERGTVFLYIFNILDIDQRNLINVDEFLKKRFGFSVSKAKLYMSEFIDNYKKIREKYTPVVAQVIKKKGPKPYSEMTAEELAVAKAKRAKKLEGDRVPVKKILKTKINDKSSAIWNSFISLTQTTLEADGSPCTYEDAIKKAQELKKENPEDYKLFSENWTST
jgi:hypothetical protein